MNYVKRRGFVAVAAVLAIFASAPAYADPDETPPPEQMIAVSIVSANGSGCKAGTYDVDVLPDNTGFRANFHTFRAEVGGNSSPIEFRKNCQLNFRIDVPLGYTYAIFRTDSRGTRDIATGARALERANYYYAGSPASQWSSHSFTGPANDDWETIDIIDPMSRVWVPCKEMRQLNANTELRVTRETSDPAAISSVTLKSKTYRIGWRRCPTV